MGRERTKQREEGEKGRRGEKGGKEKRGRRKGEERTLEWSDHLRLLKG